MNTLVLLVGGALAVLNLVALAAGSQDGAFGLFALLLSGVILRIRFAASDEGINLGCLDRYWFIFLLAGAYFILSGAFQGFVILFGG